MKKILTYILLFISTGIFAQTIPNAGFETWITPVATEIPQSWETSDSVTVGLGAGPSAVKTTDADSGTYALLLTSCTILGVKGPGIASNGIISFSGSAFTYSGGSPYSARSGALNGTYKYAPAGANDAPVVSCFLYKYNTTTLGHDTIAYGIASLTAASAYTLFSVNLTYVDFVHNPDTCLIVLSSSSRTLNDPNTTAGSNFYVDNLFFTGTVGINEVNSIISKVELFPTPANQELNVNTVLKKQVALTYSVYDKMGRKVLVGKINSQEQKINVSELTSGQYIFTLVDDNSTPVYSKQFDVVK